MATANRSRHGASIRLNETAIQPVEDSVRELQEGLNRGDIIYGQSPELL